MRYLGYILFIFFLVFIGYKSYIYDDCYVKVSVNNIYHLRGGHYYDVLKKYKCMSSEGNAIKEGYRKSLKN